VEAVAALERLDRAACRQEFEKRFTAARMARDYVRIYREVIARGVGGRRAMRGRAAGPPGPARPERPRGEGAKSH
jgi:hypothetical protein